MSEWLKTPEAWRDYFSGYERVVLVANSDAVDMDAVSETHGRGALYVFFNKVYKVLDRPFDYPALLVARSSPVGANIVYRKEVGEVLSYLPEARLTGILGLVCGEEERFSPHDSFEGRRAGTLDLSRHFSDFYPATHVPTSGFALALWLAETAATDVYLEGFTARRSVKWKLFSDHDWTYEQTCLRLLARTGKLRMKNVDPSNPYLELQRRFPDIDNAAISATAIEVLSNRMESAGVAIDRLFSLTRLQGRMDQFLRGLKPRTRKEKALGTEKPPER